jgi:hypothetical protein
MLHTLTHLVGGENSEENQRKAPNKINQCFCFLIYNLNVN